MRKADIKTTQHFLVSDAIVLKCEISKANGVVTWLKDDEKIEGNDHFTCEAEGIFRSLIVLSAELKDSGEYVCDTQDDKVVFSVTVEGKFKNKHRMCIPVAQTVEHRQDFVLNANAI